MGGLLQVNVVPAALALQVVPAAVPKVTTALFMKPVPEIVIGVAPLQVPAVQLDTEGPLSKVKQPEQVPLKAGGPGFVTITLAAPEPDPVVHVILYGGVTVALPQAVLPIVTVALDANSRPVTVTEVPPPVVPAVGLIPIL